MTAIGTPVRMIQRSRLPPFSEDTDAAAKGNSVIECLARLTCHCGDDVGVSTTPSRGSRQDAVAALLTDSHAEASTLHHI
jgi:hypothetical protein